jgi:hypothetical protein
MCAFRCFGSPSADGLPKQGARFGAKRERTKSVVLHGLLRLWPSGHARDDYGGGVGLGSVPE